MMRRFNNTGCGHRQRGVTLVELMIAVVISSIVLIGVGTVYITSKRAYLIQEEYARMQENARFAFHFLTDDIRRAGYAGCNPSVKSFLNTDASNENLFNFTEAIYGWEYTNTGPGDNFAIASSAPAGAGDAGDWDDHVGNALHATIAGNAMAGSDIIVVKSAAEVSGLTPSADVSPTDATVAVTFGGATGIPQGQLVMLSDCRSADLFMNGNNETDTSLTRPSACGTFTPCNQDPTSNQWQHVFDQDESRIVRATSRAYFIGQGASGEPSLFRLDYDRGTGGVTAQELVEGVENMQILYGLDTTPGNNIRDANRYVTFDNIGAANLADIVAVRISLLMRTPAELDRPDDTGTYDLITVSDDTLDVDIDPIDDRRLRKVFTTTIVVRNHLVTGRSSI